MIPVTVPSSLSKITPFIRRAEELDRIRSNPECRIIAFYCRNYASDLAFSIAATEDEMNCLEQILEQVQAMGEYVSIFTKEESYALCRNFADCKFNKADLEDRGGNADKNVAKLFYASATFYEMLKQFHKEEEDDDDDEGVEGANEQIEEENKRRIYAKQRAVEILRAIKDGRPIHPRAYKLDYSAEHSDLLFGGEDLSSPPSTPTTTIVNAAPEVQLLVRMLRAENTKLKRNSSSRSATEHLQTLQHNYDTVKDERDQLLKEFNDYFGQNGYENKTLEELEAIEETLKESLQKVVEQKEKTMKARLEEEEEKRACVICQVERKSVLLMPCRHLCVCEECGKRRELTKCPLCRQKVKERINVYS